MEKRLLYRAQIPVGVAALKVLEGYIYKYPEEWYQWKKYAAIEISPLHSPKRDKLTSIRTLKPSLGKVS
jgi:hypothetical protein